MRALIIDDEAPARAALRGLLQAHAEIALAGEAETIRDARTRLEAADYEVVFLDIQLRGGTGFDLLPFVRPEARIIFVTAFDEHAVRAFEVNALDYLIKPTRPQRLAEALRRIAAPAPENPAAPPSGGLPLAPGDLIHLKIGNGTTRFVAIADIVLIASNENYSEAHLGDGSRLFVRRTMKSWEEALPPGHFVRVHRMAIVNLARYRSCEWESYETLRLHFHGLDESVRASVRHVPELRERLVALGRQL